MASNPGGGSTPSSPNTSAFPTFLANDPFPSQRSGRPLSSAASDATSDFDAGTAYRVPSITGPVGEPGLPPSRPLSGTSASTEYSQRGGTARSSHPMSTARRSGRRDANVIQQAPPVVNRSHVPSITAAGFSRPMSPQRLQAQRGQNARSSTLQNRTGAISPEGVAEHRRRESNASVKTMRDDMPPDISDAPPLPVSRGNVYAGDMLPVGAPSVGSKNSTTPLNAQQQQQERSRLGAGNLSSNISPSPLTSRSNRSSLRASLGLVSRRSSRKDERRNLGPGHEKLPSGPTSPINAMNEKQRIAEPGTKPSTKNGRNYEYFAGNMLFFCSGLCLNTKAKPLNLVTFVLTALPAGMFFGFSAEWLWKNVSPALPIVFAYIFLVSISNFLHAAFTDPGILPRNLHPHPPDPEAERDPLALGPPTTEWVMVKTFAPPKVQSDLSNSENGAANTSTTAMEVPTKYCKSCNIWRPPRAHHCRVCDACIETQDHHCVWLNNCVGRRNYRYFFGYVGSASLLALTLIAFSLTHVALYAHKSNISFGQSLSGRTQERVAFAMFIYALLALPYPGSLFAYHLFLVSRGETTREYLNTHKFLPKDRHRPFAHARLFSNWLAVLTRPRHPSAMDFSGTYSEGDLRMGHTQPKSERAVERRREAAENEKKVEGLRGRFSIIGKEKVSSSDFGGLRVSSSAGGGRGSRLATGGGGGGGAGAGTTSAGNSPSSPTNPAGDVEMRKLSPSASNVTGSRGRGEPVNSTPR